MSLVNKGYHRGPPLIRRGDGVEGFFPRQLNLFAQLRPSPGTAAPRRVSEMQLRGSWVSQSLVLQLFDGGTSELDDPSPNTEFWHRFLPLAPADVNLPWYQEGG